MNNVVWRIKNFDDLSLKELYEILKIRQEVFVVEQTCYYLDADGSDEMAVHIWGEIEGKIVAYCRIFQPNIKYKEASIGRVLTSPDFRGQNYGKILMKVALQTIQIRFSTEAVRITAQDYLLKFYSDLGFMDTGKKYLEDNIPHTEMIKN